MKHIPITYDHTNAVGWASYDPARPSTWRTRLATRLTESLLLVLAGEAYQLGVLR